MELENIVGDLLIIVNIIFAIVMIVLDLKYYKSTNEQWRWVKLAYALVGMYWLAYYIPLLLGLSFTQVISYSQNWSRPGVTLTIAAMLAGAIIRAKKGSQP